jgi:hypothetical protein
VTRRACARKRGHAEHIVHAAHVVDRESPRIEDFLPSRDGCAGIGIRITLWAGQVSPGIEEGERPGIEPRTQDVVDPNVERLPRQR